jgi:hypothetical protein
MCAQTSSLIRVLHPYFSTPPYRFTSNPQAVYSLAILYCPCRSQYWLLLLLLLWLRWRWLDRVPVACSQFHLCFHDLLLFHIKFDVYFPLYKPSVRMAATPCLSRLPFVLQPFLYFAEAVIFELGFFWVKSTHNSTFVFRTYFRCKENCYFTAAL